MVEDDDFCDDAEGLMYCRLYVKLSLDVHCFVWVVCWVLVFYIFLYLMCFVFSVPPGFFLFGTITLI